MKKFLNKKNIIFSALIIISFIVGFFVGDSSAIKRVNKFLNGKNSNSYSDNTYSESSSSNNESSNSPKTYSIDETLTFSDPNTNKKLYSLKINSIKTSTEFNSAVTNQPKKLIIIDYTYKNLGSDEEISFFDSNFKVFDSEGNILEEYPYSGDSQKYSKKIPIGASCTSTAVFGLNSGNKLKINFYDNPFASKATATFDVTIK